MPISKTLQDNYVSMISGYLEHIPIYTLDNFEFVVSELEELTDNVVSPN